MDGVCVKFYTYELEKSHGMLLYEQILELAKKNGIQGGSVFRTIAGFGHHGVLHEEHFFELASNVPVEIDFYVKKEEARLLLDLVKKEKLKLFYSITNAEFGFIQ